MSNINQVSAEIYQIPVKKTRGRRGTAIEAMELERMRDGVKKYVQGQVDAGKEVCPILTKYVSSLEMGHPAQ
jgi:hypothetical protein